MVFESKHFIKFLIFFTCIDFIFFKYQYQYAFFLERFEITTVLFLFLWPANQARRRFVRSQCEVSISFASELPQLKRGRHSISEHLHVLYENSIVYGDICMYYRISIFQKTAISILDTDVGYIACLLPLRSRIAPQ